MRILLTSHGASPFGAERVLLVLAAGLSARGHDVVLEFPHEGSAVAKARELTGVRVLVSRRPRLPRSAGEAVRYVLGAAPATLRLARTIRRGGYDLVWVNSLFNPLAAFAGRLAGARVVWHVHERNFRGPARVAGELALRFGCQRAVAVSEFVATTFRAAATRFRVLRNVDFRGVSPRPPRAGDGFVVGYLGQLEPRKRVGDLVEAIARVPDIRGVIVGAGKRAEDIAALVRRMGVASRIELVGFQSDVVHFLGTMDCLVMPSRDEPCPLAACEAMSAGVPVIASDHGSHREVLGEAALYYPLGDVPALAARLGQLRTDRSLREALRARGLERARASDPERWLDRAEAIALEAAGDRLPKAGLAPAGTAP